jgi:hypothetical protein
MINGYFDLDPIVATISVESWNGPQKEENVNFRGFLLMLKILHGIRRLSIGQYSILFLFLFLFFNSKFRRCFSWTENTWAWNRG